MKRRIDTSYEDESFAEPRIKPDFTASGDKSAFVPYKKKVNDANVNRDVTESISQRKTAFRVIKDLFNKKICPCAK